MTVTRLRIPLEQREYSALLKMAQAELRSPDDQIRYVLREELRHRGLLQSDDIQYQEQKQEVHHDA